MEDDEQLRRDLEAKSRECRDARKALEDLESELMRKSMHVGSLAFAIEAQVLEKSTWVRCLSRFTAQLHSLKHQHRQLSRHASSELAHFQTLLNRLLNSHFLERRHLYNNLVELKGNIRVFCRCRPLNAHDTPIDMFDFESASAGQLTLLLHNNRLGGSNSKKTFKFDAVFSPQADQADVFKDTAPFATSVLDGYNLCIFAYGQTGTGKTFTMEGTPQAPGVNFRILEELFSLINHRRHLYRYSVSVSALEVYNEQIRDLLASSTKPPKRLEIRQVGEGGIHHVPGLVEAPVSKVSEAWQLLQTGTRARAVGSTNANQHSSRSHCIHCVMVKGENLLNGERTNSKLWLVDLAGSERIAKTEVQGDRLKETQNINRSLSALADVISALATKTPHIPYRNSKLTHLLQDSLGGDSKTLMFVQISPSERDLGETICSLNFASRVRGLELGPAKRQLDTTEFLRYKQLAEKAKVEAKSKDLEMKKMEETVHGLELKLKGRDLKNKSLQDKIKELESQLLVERKLARQHVDTKIAERQMRHEEDHAMRPPLASVRVQPVGDEKENKPPEMSDQFYVVGTCAVPRRRNSLIPIPLPLPLQLQVPAMCEQDNKCLPNKHIVAAAASRKRSSILRRSLQKKCSSPSPLRVSVGRLKLALRGRPMQQG